jgi:hypothetical protein
MEHESSYCVIDEDREMNMSDLKMEAYKTDGNAQQYSIVPKMKDGGKHKPIQFVSKLVFTGGIPQVKADSKNRNHVNKCMKIFLQLNTKNRDEFNLLKKFKQLNKYFRDCCEKNKMPNGTHFIHENKGGKPVARKAGLNYGSFVKLGKENPDDEEFETTDPRNFDEDAEGLYFVGLNIPTLYEANAEQNKEKTLTIKVREWDDDVDDLVERNITRLDELREYIRSGAELVMMIVLKKFWLAKGDPKSSLMLEVTNIDVYKRGSKEATTNNYNIMDKYKPKKTGERVREIEPKREPEPEPEPQSDSAPGSEQDDSEEERQKEEEMKKKVAKKAKGKK